jgi:hypothetical protein
MIQSLHSRVCLPVGLALAVVAVPTTAQADHAWGCYHWSRSDNPLLLDVGDNVSSTWDSYLSTAVQDWDQSSVLELTKVPGGSPRRNCRPTNGRIEVCAASYGNNGWLGIAQIWVNNCHITQATTRLNDYYFNQAQYNTPAYRRFVMCQEIGHDFGLDHQDETFNNPNLGSCMDYTNDPDGGPGGASNSDPANEHPNKHDYDQLEDIYAHFDGAAVTLPGVSLDKGDLGSPAEWGVLVRTLAGGRVQVFERALGNGAKLLTRVTWADPEKRRAQ